MTDAYPIDVVVLVADLDQQETIRSLLDKRTESLGIRVIRHELLKHPRHDPGCFNEAPELLQSYQARAEHALVILDREGSGQDGLSATAIEEELVERLAVSGWGERANVVVIDPELEIWVWSASPRVDEVLGWSGQDPSLRDWLKVKDLWPAEAEKPPRPKEALRAALREVRQRAVATVFSALAERVGLERCRDSSFKRLREILVAWFPAEIP